MKFQRNLHIMLVVAALAFAGACGDSKQKPEHHSQVTAGDGGDDPFHNSGANPGAGTGDGGAAGRDGGGAPEPTCGSSPFDASSEPVNVLLVIDKSGSMNDTPADWGSDKWTAMKTSVAAALDPVKKQLRLGLELYPLAGCDMPGGSDVDVDVQAGDKALSMVSKALADADATGGTPTAAALARALEYYTKGAGKALDGGKYVLLATDGGPNCNEALSCDADACTVNIDEQCPTAVDNCCDATLAGEGAQSGCLDDAETLDQIAALHDAGIDTFVVGIPGSEAYTNALDAFAKAGGRARAKAPFYYQVNASGSADSGLTSVLGTITTGLIKSCRLQLGSMPPALDKLNVEIDGTPVPQMGDDGWKLDTATTPPTVELLGKTCQHLEEDGAQSVKVTFGCPTLVE